MPSTPLDDPDTTRWHAILNQIEGGRIADVTPEALAWFCDRAYRLERLHRQLVWRLGDALNEVKASMPGPARATTLYAQAAQATEAQR